MARRGDRIRVLSTSDAHVSLRPGTRGTVEYVDALGTVHVQFDDGTRLGLIADEDSFELIEEPKRAEPREE
jgi:hypothetical protein